MAGAIDRLDNAAATDAIAQVVGAIASAVPLVGGPLAAMVAQWRQHVGLSRLIEVLREIERELGAVRGSVDPTAGNDFRRALEWSVESATRTKHAAKRSFYAAATARTATHARPDEAEQVVMLDTLDALQEPHLAVLAAVASHRQPPAHPREYLDRSTLPGQYLAERTGLRPELLDRCLEDLATQGVIRSARIPMAPLQRGQDAPPVVTPFGRRFVEYIGADQ